jgi:thiol:disulfide interchange protein DsbG
MPSRPLALVICLLSLWLSPLAAADDPFSDPEHAEIWQDLQNSACIQDGQEQAPRVLYTFTDPNCPYCRDFWKKARPWVEAGDVQLRHVMIGVLEPDSPAKASVLLGADDPAAALQAHESGASPAAPSAQPRHIEEQVYSNNQLFESLGFFATPTTVFRVEDELDRIQGMPDEAAFIELMGGEAP